MGKIEFMPNGNGENAVSARSLYEFLEIKEHFTQWIERMFDYGFNESVDYQAIKEFISHSNGFGGTYKTDYALTLDTAKEIAMLQRTEKGKQARQYFIECEKQNKIKPMSIEEMIIANAQSMIETKKRLTNLEDFTHTKFEETFTKIDEIKALSSTRPEYFTIVGYASYIRVSVDNTLAKRLGATASKLCKERGLLVDKVPDGRYGHVGSYPLEILKEVFKQAA